MSLIPPAPTSSTLKTHRIKRKPPPVIHISERYPSPDPNDPFAPLWVLRNRTSSALLGQPPSKADLHAPMHRTSYELYPSISNDSCVNDTIGPLKSPSRPKKHHYRRRSQSMAVIPTPPASASSEKFPIMHPSSPTDITFAGHMHSPPRLIPDNCSDTTATVDSHQLSSNEAGPNVVVPLSRATSRNKLARFLLPKKSLTNIDQRPESTSPRKIGKASISVPLTNTTLRPSTATAERAISIPTIQNSPSLDSASYTRKTPFTSTSCVNDLGNYQHTPLRHEHHSLSLSVSAPTNSLKKRGSTLPVPHTSSDTLARSPSLIHISTPSPSLSFSHSTSSSAYAAPRPAPPPPASPRRPNKLVTSNSRRQSQVYQTYQALPAPLPQPEYAIPSASQLAQACTLPIIAESGVRLPFGSLFANQRTIVIFIRHFWCPMCQDYMGSLSSLLRPEMLRLEDDEMEQAGEKAEGKERTHAKLVIIGNGAHTLISKYRQIFDLPFTVYTDPTLAVYTALGMGRDGPLVTGGMQGDMECGGYWDEKLGLSETGSCDAHGVGGRGYVKHGLMGGIAMVVMRALKVGMPVWEKGGDVGQLGGEYVFGPGLSCSFAHRMQSTKGHAPIVDVIKAAGVVPLPNLSVQPVVSLPHHTPSRTSTSSASGRPSISTHRSLDVVSPSAPPHTQNGKTRRRKLRKESMRGLKGSATWNGGLGDVNDGGDGDKDKSRGWMEDRVRDLKMLRERKSFRRGTGLGTNKGLDAGAGEGEMRHAVVEEEEEVDTAVEHAPSAEDVDVVFSEEPKADCFSESPVDGLVTDEAYGGIV